MSAWDSLFWMWFALDIERELGRDGGNQLVDLRFLEPDHAVLVIDFGPRPFEQLKGFRLPDFESDLLQDLHADIVDPLNLLIGQRLVRPPGPGCAGFAKVINAFCRASVHRLSLL